MRRRLQSAVLSDDDHDALVVAGLQNKADLLDKQQEDNPQALLDELNIQVKEEDGATVVKKRVFTI